MKRRLIAAVVLCVAASFASSGVAQEDTGERLVYRSTQLFNQHLYKGSMSRPRAIAYDAERREVWVAETDNGVVGVFSPSGVELFSFTSRLFVRDPSRLAVTPRGELIVIEGKRDVLRRFNYRGDYLGTVTLDKLPPKVIFGAVAFDKRSNMYVADNQTAQIFVFTRDGRLKLQFGSQGTDEGQFTAICGIAIAQDGKIYVADQRAIAVQVFDDQGNFLRGWGKHEMGAENFSLPSGIALDSKGRVIVSDELRHSVKVFTSEGKMVSSFGGLGPGAGQISFPTDVAVDENDRIYVTERTNSRVQVFELSGTAR